MIKRIFPALILLFIFSFRKPIGLPIHRGHIVIYPTEDTTSLIRNPAMGWGLYDDASGKVAIAENYWAAQDEAAKKYASFFYVRWRWSEMEPEEGKYAWLYDDNFKKLIKGALDRGLKLAFRFYVNRATPEYVREAGAKGYQIPRRGGGNNWTPYPDDSIFQAKFSKFIHAFAKEFDDPSTVDFIDGNGLGAAGEGNNIRVMKGDSQSSVFKWIVNLYANNFHKVLLVTNLASQEGFKLEKKVAYYGNAFLPRRDGLGSYWYTKNQKKMMASLFPQMPLIGEGAYWKNDSALGFFEKDPRYKGYTHPVTWKDVLSLTYRDAISSHANTLDLRRPEETKRWIETAPELVREFMIKGGYRFYPNKLSIPKQIKSGDSFEIEHEWRNTGVGMCPNNNKRWNYKYKVAFALIQKSNMQVKELFIDQKADPSQWIKGTDYKYSFKGKVSDDLPEGDYILGLAIIDTSNYNTPGIKLAVNNLPKTPEGWVEIESIHITK